MNATPNPPNPPNADQDGQLLDLRDLVWKLRRYSWLLVLPPVAAVCFASIYYKMSPVIYESHVVVSIGDRADVGPSVRGMVNPDRDRGGGNGLALVDRKIRSREFLNALVDRLGLRNDAGVESAAVMASRQFPSVSVQDFAERIAGSRIQSRIRVRPMDGDFVSVSTTGGDAESAQRLAGVITDLLIEESRRSNLERVQARSEFSQDQVTVYQERLRESENALQAYQESILRRSLRTTPVNDGNVSQARAALHAVEQEMDQARDRIETAKRSWALERPGELPPTLSSPESDDLQRRLIAAEQALTVSSLSSSSSQGGSGAQANVTALRQSLFYGFQGLAATLPGDLSDAARSAIVGIATDRAILRSLQAKRDRLNGFIEQFVRGVESSPKEKMELARLQNAVDSNRELLASFQHEVQSSRVSEALATSSMGLQVTVVDPPQIPLRPSSPDPIRIFGAAFLLGPLMSVGIVMAFEKFSMAIRTVEQAELEIGKPVLGTVPRIEGWERSDTGYIARHWAILSIVLVLLLTGLFHGLSATVLNGHSHHRTSASPPGR